MATDARRNMLTPQINYPFPFTITIHALSLLLWQKNLQTESFLWSIVYLLYSRVVLHGHASLST